MGAHGKFRMEQTRQKFRPQSPQAIFDPHLDALMPALKLSGCAVFDWVNANTHLFLPIRVPKPPDFADLVNEVLLQQPPAPPEAEETGAEKGDPQPPHTRFMDDEIEAAAGLLESMPADFTLNEMLAAGRQQELSDNSLHHASLKVLQWFGEDGVVVAWPEPAQLGDQTFFGDDLGLKRRA